MIITLKDGSKKEYAEAKAVIDIAYDISEGLARAACAGEVNGEVVDLRTVLDSNCELNILTAKDEKGLAVLRHTASHVMAVIGQHRQVLCITHLPQIAAMADTHFEIEKHVEGTETITQIHPLEGEESVRELARLLGGAQITPAVLGNAREMKELAQQQKNTRLK